MSQRQPAQGGTARPRRWLAAATVLGTIALLATGCASNSHTELPSLEKDKRQLLTKEQQKSAITTLGQKADADTAAAKQQIEKAR